jgi:hypothetical protein
MLAKVDALFEAALGVALVICAASGVLDGSDFPRPVGPAVLVVAGVGLVLLGAVIWSVRIPLRVLAAGNAIAALAGIVWLAAGAGFSAKGTAVVAITVAGLACLAAAQAATLRA